MIRRDGFILLADEFNALGKGENIEEARVRFRTLGCSPCSGAIESDADDLNKIIEEVKTSSKSERENRAIDYETDGSMEMKKREGYF